MTDDFCQARGYAVCAVDAGFMVIMQSPTGWRNLFGNNGGFPFLDVPFNGGRFSLQAIDPLDGDLNNGDHPVLLIGIGYCGNARYMLQVELDGSGALVPGTWQRVVD